MAEDKLQIGDASIPMWVRENRLVNERGESLGFGERMFLYDIYKDRSKYQVVKKCAQIGMTVTATIKAYYVALKCGFNVIFTMASDSDVSEFVKTKADKIFQSNPVMRKYMFSDTVGLKQVEQVHLLQGDEVKDCPDIDDRRPPDTR